MRGENQNHRISTRPVEQARLETLLAKTRTRIQVFVAGPYLNPAWTAEDLADKGAGVKLRYRVKSHVEQCGYDAVLGEHSGVAEITTETLPSLGNLAASELALVNGVDAVVLIPDSPGSFCEAGAWSMMESVSRKSLILPNVAYQHEQSYFGLALIPQLAADYARIEWVDYNDHESTINIVTDFLSRVVDRVIIRGLRGG